MASLVSALLASSPSKTDVAQTPAWLDLLGTAFAAGPVVFEGDKDPDVVFTSIFSYLESIDLTIRKSASMALTALVSKSITPAMIEAAVAEHTQKKPKSPLRRILAHMRLFLDALPYAGAMPQVFAVLASLLLALRHRPTQPPSENPPTAAELLLLDVVQKIGELRIKKGFEHKEAADEVLKAAMSVLGPEVVLRVLPLGLIPEDR